MSPKYTNHEPITCKKGLWPKEYLSYRVPLMTFIFYEHAKTLSLPSIRGWLRPLRGCSGLSEAGSGLSKAGSGLSEAGSGL